jgi:hypothetical protein
MAIFLLARSDALEPFWRGPRLTGIVEAARQVDFSAVPQSGEGGPDAAFLTLEYDHGGSRRKKYFSAMDAPVLETVKPLLDVTIQDHAGGHA